MRAKEDRNLPEPDTEIDQITGYHIAKITRGFFGEPSKINEETQEFMDAINQENSILALVELSDLYGAIEGYLNKYHPSITMRSLKNMNEATARAFISGERK
jgi:hypothetical protein